MIKVDKLEISKSAVMSRAWEMKNDHNLSISDAMKWAWKEAKHLMAGIEKTPAGKTIAVLAKDTGAVLKTIKFNIFGTATNMKNKITGARPSFKELFNNYKNNNLVTVQVY